MKRKVGNPITYTDTDCNAILFIDSATMAGRTMATGQLRRHVLHSFLVMVYNIFNVYMILRSPVESAYNLHIAGHRVWYGNVNLREYKQWYPSSKPRDHK